MTAHLELPARLQSAAHWLPSMVGIGAPPSVKSVGKMAAALVGKLKLALPPPRPDKVAARLGGMLGLPPRIISLASTLLIIFGQARKPGDRRTNIIWSNQSSMEAAAAPLIGRRVRVEGLAARPELNGRCGEATAY